MPFLNPPDVLPEAMRFISRALLANDGELPEDELLRLISPLGLVEAVSGSMPKGASGDAEPWKRGGRTIAQASLSAMRGAGLVDQKPGGVACASRLITERFTGWKDMTAPAFAEFLLDSVLCAVNDSFDEDQQGGAEDLATAIALVLSVPDPLKPIASFETGDAASKSLGGYQARYFGDDPDNWIVRNKERYQSLQRWMPYLGLARQVPFGGLLIDPSIALRRLALPLLKEVTEVGTLLDALADRMPYVDRGPIGGKLAGMISGYSDQIFPGLAVGLYVLHLGGEVSLVPRSDAPGVVFPLGLAQTKEYVQVAPGGTKRG